MQNPCRNTALEKPMITHQATTRNNLKLPLHQLIPCPLFKENFNLPSKVDDSFCLDSVPGPIAFGTHCASGRPQRKLAHQEVWYVKRSQQQLFTVLVDGDQHLHLLYLLSLALMLSCLIIEQINNPTLTWGNYFPWDRIYKAKARMAVSTMRPRPASHVLLTSTPFPPNINYINSTHQSSSDYL